MSSEGSDNSADTVETLAIIATLLVAIGIVAYLFIRWLKLTGKGD